MINKIKENWLGILLTLVVLLSIVLMALMWINPLSYDRANRFNTNRDTTQQTTPQSIGDIYLPTQVVQTRRDKSQSLLFGNKKNLVLTIRQKMHDWKLTGLQRVARGNSNTYLNYLRTDDSVMMSYADAMASGVFNQTFSQSINSSRLGKINHIVIPLSGRRVMYLLNDHNYTVYRLNISKNADRAGIKKLLTATKQKINVDHKIIDGHPTMTYPHSFSLPTFGYQITSQSIDNLTQNLLSSTNSSSITVRHQGNDTVYMDGASKRLDYHRDTRTVTFTNYLGKDSSYRGLNLYRHLYRRLVATGTSLSLMRFDAVNEKKQTIVFRSYVEGFPIFNDHDYGVVRLQANADGVARYKLSLYSLNMPLPVKERNVKLPASAVVYNELRQAGKNKKISGLRVGYRWDTSSVANKVVDLVPTYYVHYQGKWVDYQTLINN